MAIQGIDRSTPDDIVKDGTCEELHNLRYKDGAWRPVSKIASKYTLHADNADELEIVYHHPAAGENVYIARYKDEPETFATITFHEDEPETISAFATIKKTVAISHFGNVLIFYGATSIYNYIYMDGEYKEYTMPMYARTKVVDYNRANIDPAQVYKSGKWVKYIDGETTGTFEGSWFPIFNSSTNTIQIEPRDGKWHGEMLLFTTFVMDDGTNISPSPLHLIQSNTAYTPNSKISRKLVHRHDPIEEQGIALDDWATTSLERYVGISYLPRIDLTTSTPIKEPMLMCCAPTIRVYIPKTQESQIAKRIAVWGTRIHPTWRYELGTDGFSKNIVDMLADNDLANKPFYLIKEFDISKMIDEDGYWEDESTFIESPYKAMDITLTADVMSNVVTNRVYVPNNNIHTFIPQTVIDYNRSLHLGGAKILPADGYNPYSEATTGSDKLYGKAVYLTLNENKKILSHSNYSDKADSIAPDTPFANIVSYPDYRATRCAVDARFDVALTEATVNNFAWHHATHTENEKFPPIRLDSRIKTDIDVDTYEHSVDSNDLYVSAANNPFSFPFENSYSFGSANNRIIAMQSAAIKIGDEKVGALPLYVFTTEGIYALRAGENTLYAAVNPINYDKIINPNTLAINGAVVYITEKGVHILSEGGSAIISSPIHDANGMPPLDFLRDCDIIWPKQYNEIVLQNSSDSKAFVYNLDSGYWSTRLLTGTKINTDEIVNTDTIYDLSNEDEAKPLSCSIVTRPIKLGNVEFKRLETIIPRMSSDDNYVLSMNIWGAVNSVSYLPLRKVPSMEIDGMRTHPFVVRRTPFSAKYFKMVMNIEPLSGEPLNVRITNIDFEWYRKFQHRMR